MKRILLNITLMLTMLFLTKTSFGVSWVTGYVLEQDSITPISGATVLFSGVSTDGDTLLYQFVSDSTGFYDAEIEAGVYWVRASAEGYETECLSDSLWVGVGWYIQYMDFILSETHYPVSYVSARLYTNDLVRVSWSMHEPLLFEDFETGDFSRFNWDNTISPFPWAVDSTQAYEGQYCMKSTCEGQSDGLSQIEVPVYIPWAGQMSFYSKISSEAIWDVGTFSVDGVKLMECSGLGEWEEHRFEVTEGEHVFRWSYKKDASNDEGDDCFYVDDIHFYLEDSLKGDSSKGQCSFQYFDLFRRRFNEAPMMMASHISDTLFMEMNWNTLTWGQYSWGVSCYYEGNRGHSDTIWSVALDKDMTTTFEVNVTTNVGLSPQGALVSLFSSEGQSYQGELDAEGYLMLPAVRRGDYSLLVQLDGFEDFADDSVSVMAPTQLTIELLEEVKALDSLYVSSTGWAMWLLEGERSRNLQFFEIQLNNEVVGTTLDDFFQFDVSGLQTGQLYTTRVRPVYLSDTCEWKSCEWIYRPCAEFQGCSSFDWALQDESVRLFWEQPENDTVMGAVVFRDGECLGYVTDTFFVDATVIMQGVVDYCVRMVYDGALDGDYYSMSCADCLQAYFPAYCDPPVNLEGENYFENSGDFGALISWGERPDPIFEWLHYDNGEYKNSVGGNDEPVIFWSIRFSEEALAEYQGTLLKKIRIFDVAAGSYQLWVYVGGETAPQTMVWFHEMTLNGSYAWHEQSVSPALEIPENEPIWIVVGQQGLRRPAAACADMGNPDGRWVSLNGTEWHDINYYNLHYTWMLQAFVTNRSARLRDNNGFVLQDYHLYRSYDNVDYQVIAVIPSADGQDFYQYRDVLVDDDHNAFYYKLTAHYLSDDGEECESDYAASLLNPDVQFVVVDDHWKVNDNQLNTVSIYPNPSSGQLSVEGRGLRRLSVFNALGQRVLEREVQAESVQLDFSGLANGIYQLQVTTEDGLVSKRFVLSR